MRIEQATDAEKVERDKLAHAEWGELLTVFQFIEREKRLRSQKWAARDMASWVLKDDGGKILSSCETFRMPAAPQGSVYGFASVFTEEQLRGKGHAAKLLEGVMKKIEQADGQTQAFILFSEVGPALYERLGFKALPSFARVFSAAKLRAMHPSMQLLSEDQLLALWPSLGAPRSAFAVWPSGEQIDWHLERERIYSSLLGQERPKYHGAILGQSLIAWTLNYKAQALEVLFMRSKTTLEGQALLSNACACAHDRGLGKVLAWESEEFTGWERLGIFGERVERTSSLAMIRPVKPGLSPESWAFVSRSCWI